MSFATTQIDPEIVILSEVSQTERDKYYRISLICVILKNNININNINELIYKQNKLMVTRGEGWGKGQLRSLVLTCTPCYI